MTTEMDKEFCENVQRIVNWWYRNNWNLAVHLYRNGFMQEDLGQEVLFNMARYPPDFKTYNVAPITVHICIQKSVRIRNFHKYAIRLQPEDYRYQTRKKLVYEEEFEREEEVEVQQLLEKLPSRQRSMLKLRYGIGCPSRTNEQLAQRYSITKQRISQIEHEALSHLAKHHRRPEEP